MTEEHSRNSPASGSSDAHSHGAGDPDAGHSLWQACAEQLAQELPEQQFNTWIKPLTAQVTEDFSKVTLFVANRFKLDWIRAQYAGRISASFYGYSPGQKTPTHAEGIVSTLEVCDNRGFP